MSAAEGLADRPESDGREPIDIIADFNSNGAAMRQAAEIAAASPSEETLSDFSKKLFVVKQGVAEIEDKSFFRDADNPLVVTAAVDAVVGNITDSILSMRKVTPDRSPYVAMVSVPLTEDFSSWAGIAIGLDDPENPNSPNDFMTDKETLEVREAFVEMLVEAGDNRASVIAGNLKSAMIETGDALADSVGNSEAVTKYVRRVIRKQKFQEYALKGGGIALASCIGSLAADSLRGLF